MKKQSHFVTRLRSNALVEALAHYQVDESQELKGVVSDQKVFIGKAEAGLEVRMVVYRDLDGKDWHYITSRFDISATSVVELYLNRWKIETFFGWIKRHLQLGHWYSENENDVLIQLYAALITFLLLKIYSANSTKAQFRVMRIDFIRWVQRHLANVVSTEQWLSYCELLDYT
jgi:IS4 transposase